MQTSCEEQRNIVVSRYVQRNTAILVLYDFPLNITVTVR